MGEEKQPTWRGLLLFLLFGKYYVPKYTIFRKGPINNLKEVLGCSVSVILKRFHVMVEKMKTQNEKRVGEKIIILKVLDNFL